MGNAVACWGPSKFGSVKAVRSGIVLGVEMTRCRVELAAEDEAIGRAARTQTTDATHQKETLDRTAGDGSGAIGRPGKDLTNV
jgi:hypothetical protein